MQLITYLSLLTGKITTIKLTFEKIILSILIVSVIVQAIYWLYFFLLKPNNSSTTKFTEGISVIICGHNELENLKNFLPKFLDQDYPTYEVIFVNDRSTDKTMDFFTSYSNPKLTIIEIKETPNNWNSKKWALSQGAKKAQYNYLLFSDADCYPKSSVWIQEMSNGFLTSEAVIGYSEYESNTGFLNKLIQYETYITAITYLGFTDKKIPYMAVGRNFAIKKNIYLKFNFGAFKHLQGGDDDLIINHLNPSIKAVYSPISSTRSIPKNRLKDYFKQKLRHINISNHYSPKSKIIIGLFNLSNLSFYLSIFLLFDSINYAYYAIGLIVLRTSILFYNFTVGSNELGSKLNSIHIVWLDFIYTIFLWTIGPIALLAKKIKWK